MFPSKWPDQSAAGLRRRNRVGLSLLVLAFVAAFATTGQRAWWLDVPGNWYAHVAGHRPLNGARSWFYNLAHIDVDRIQKSNADLVVMDFARDGGRLPLSPADVERIKVRADGTRRLVVSYMSIGEAEEFRFYWRPEWTSKREPAAAPAPDGTQQPAKLVRPADMPDWEVAANCAWPGAHAVRFWTQSWKDIIFAGPDAYLKKIIQAGFDGVYLDRVDMYGILAERYGDARDARAKMVSFVAELAQTARKLKPGFLIIPQNAEDLLTDRDYRRVIDAIGKEDLLFGETQTGARNDAKGVANSLALISHLRWDWKPVFVVEYLTTVPAIEDARLQIERLGLVPTFATRSLDGEDPTKPRVSLEAENGTPEFTQKNCDKTNSW